MSEKVEQRAPLSVVALRAESYSVADDSIVISLRVKYSPNKRRGKNCRSRTMAFSFERTPTKTPELSPEGFPATYQIDQAAACAFRFLRQPSRPNAPKPVAKSGSAPGSGVEASPSSAEPGCSTAVINPRLK